MKIRTNIVLYNSVVLASIIITATFFIITYQHIQHIEKIHQKNAELVKVSDEIFSDADSLTKYLQFYITTVNPEFKTKYHEKTSYLLALTPRPESMKVFPNKTISIVDMLRLYAEAPNEVAILDGVHAELLLYYEINEKVMENLERENRHITADNYKTSIPLIRSTLSLFFDDVRMNKAHNISEQIFAFRNLVESRQKQKLASIEKQIDIFILLAFLGMATILITTLFSQYFTNKRILLPLEETTRFANDSANGDMRASIRIAGSDEIAVLRRALVAFVQSLQSAAHMQEVVNKLEYTMESLSKIATKLETSMYSSSQSSQAQTSSILETVTAMEQMNITVNEVSKSASTASSLSEETKTRAEAGEQSVQKLIDSINSVNDKSLSMKADIAELLNHANNISSIMNVISDIADQTNLLALNAAIEAARAGDAGRGFAVVADEVRKLAEKTMASTSGVASAINAIQTSVENSRKQVDTTVIDVECATQIAQECGTSLQEIVSFAEESADKVLSITTASEEQARTSEEISRAVARVNNIASNTNTVINEVTSTIQELLAEKNTLNTLITDLKVGMTPKGRRDHNKKRDAPSASEANTLGGEKSIKQLFGKRATDRDPNAREQNPTQYNQRATDRRRSGTAADRRT